MNIYYNYLFSKKNGRVVLNISMKYCTVPSSIEGEEKLIECVLEKGICLGNECLC